VPAAQRNGRVPPLVNVAKLQLLFEAELGSAVPPADFLAYLQRLEDSDAIDLLVFRSTGQAPQPHDRVLLDPHARRCLRQLCWWLRRTNPTAPGTCASRVCARASSIWTPPNGWASGRPSSTCSGTSWKSLFARDLALREPIDGVDYVVFPAQCTSELKFPGAAVFGVAFGLAGPVRGIYATLIAQLAHYEGFLRREFFQDAAAYHSTAGPRCLVRLYDHGDGTGELHVSFDEKISAQVRQGFLEFVGKHVESRAVPGSVARRHAHHCGGCRRPFDDAVVKTRLDDRRKDLLCPVCERRTPLVNLLTEPTIASTTVAEQMDAAAKIGRQRITAAWVLKAKEAQGKYDVFLSHNSKDKPIVKEVAERLKRLGLRPWLDVERLVPGKSWVAALQKVIADIPCAAVFFGPAGIGPWEQEEMEGFLLEFVGSGARVVPVILPNAPPELELPAFLRTKTWVNLRHWQDAADDDFYRLVCGVIGKEPDAPLGGLKARHVWDWQQSVE